MAWLAESLPVRLFPEESGIALVRIDVIDNGRRSQSSHAIALGAQGIHRKEPFPRSTPSGAVAPRVGRAASILLCIAILRLVLLAPALKRRLYFRGAESQLSTIRPSS